MRTFERLMGVPGLRPAGRRRMSGSFVAVHHQHEARQAGRRPGMQTGPERVRRGRLFSQKVQQGAVRPVDRAGFETGGQFGPPWRHLPISRVP